MIEWLQYLYAICSTAPPPANWREIAIAANFGTALAYFWIPAVMAVVFTRWREELPYRWLWIGFVVFITACGLSHVVHAFHALNDQSPHLWPELAVMAGTAVVSLATAAGFTYLLPTILKLASPAAARRKLEAAVESATAGLQQALEHERLLLLEVHHRVKNNLQVTASLVNLHMRRSPGPVEELKALRDRITAMAAVHGQLQEVGSTTLRARPFVESLARSLKEAKGDSGAAVEVTGPDFAVQLDHAASFALILHEVLANAFRHAFPDQKNNLLSIALAREGDRRSVTISDNGIGMTDRPEGIGKTLVKALAVQLGARVTWEAAEGSGVVFRMTFENAASQRSAAAA
jgi:two-component sensor histidine kinase